MSGSAPAATSRDTALVRAARGQLGPALAVTVAVGLAYTLLTVLVPEARVSLAAPELRVAVEVSGLLFVLFAALVMALPGDLDVRPARDAFVAALVVLAVANAAFAVGPFVTSGRLAVARPRSRSPWRATGTRSSRCSTSSSATHTSIPTWAPSTSARRWRSVVS